MNFPQSSPVLRSGPVQVPLREDLGVQPLTAAERAAATDTARRIRMELRGLVDLLPETQRGASAMARALDIDRNTCQRIVAATARGEADASLLIQLPGIQGLRQFVEAVGRRLPGSDASSSIAGVAAAVDRVEKVIDELAGSQRKLRERLEMDRAADETEPAPVDSVSTRRTLFRAAVDIVGRFSEFRLSTRIIRPAPDDPMHTESIRMTGHIGHVARPLAVPLEVYGLVPEQLLETGAGSGGPAFQTLDAKQSVGDTPGFLMKSFCTQPLPRVTSRAAGTRMVHAIDETSTPGQPSDIFVADRRAGRDKHPATQHPPIGDVSTIMNFPARRFVMEVYLHRDIARRCIPSMEVHLSALQSGPMLLGRWSTRLPGGPRLELLPPGSAGGLDEIYPRHTEATLELFGSMAWNPAEFVGYRCDVAYPIWRAAYCMMFDFTGNELPHPIGTDDERKLS